MQQKQKKLWKKNMQKIHKTRNSKKRKHAEKSQENPRKYNKELQKIVKGKHAEKSQ